MSGVTLPISNDILPCANNQAVELIEQKLASAEAEAGKLSMLLADIDIAISHTDIQSPGIGSNGSGDDALAAADTRWKFNIISPILASVPDPDTSQGTLVSRVCHLEGVITSFRSTINRISRERDCWRREKFSSDERFARAADTFKDEMKRLQRNAETERVKAVEAKKKAENTAEQLRSDLLQAVNSLVCVYCCLLTWLPTRKIM